jgi:CBS domain-containing protein
MEPLEAILEAKEHDLHVVAPDATVLEAVEAMCLARVGALLVMDDAMLVGIFSERDLMTRVVLTQRDPSVTRIGEVMTRELVCVRPDTLPGEAMALFTDYRVRHLPVVDSNRIAGIVSIGDLVRWTIRDREHKIDELLDYVTGRYPG